MNLHRPLLGPMEIELCENLEVPSLEWIPEGVLRLRMAPHHDLDEAFHSALAEYLEVIRDGFWSIFANPKLDRRFSSSATGVIIRATELPVAPPDQ